MKPIDLYDLNFWTPPDWRRESSLDPIFLAVAGGSLILLAMLAWVSWNFQTVLALNGKILVVNTQNDRIVKKADRVRRMQKELEVWNRVLAALEWKHRARILWCRQLAAFQRRVPDDVIFTAFNYTSQITPLPASRFYGTEHTAGEKSADSAKKSRTETMIPVVHGQLIISGVGYGREPADTINRFSRTLQEDSELKLWIQEAAILDLGPARMPELSETAKTFTLACEYKPVRWFYVPSAKSSNKPR